MNRIIQKESKSNIFANFINRFEELLILQFDKITDATKRKHKSTWYFSIPYQYRKGVNNLIITFDNSTRLYIDYKWNIDDYIKEIVPIKYHNLLRDLLNKCKKD